MKKQRRGLNRYTIYKTKKRGKTLYQKLSVKKKNSRKKMKKNTTQKTVLTGFEPTSMKIDGS